MTVDPLFVVLQALFDIFVIVNFLMQNYLNRKQSEINHSNIELWKVLAEDKVNE